MVADNTTLKKAILLFDEIHFIDRPSFMFGNFGTIATASPMRAYEQSFRDNTALRALPERWASTRGVSEAD
jgi:hypothetical protein